MSFYIPGGTDLDNVFEPLRAGMTPRGNVGFVMPGGQDIAQRYAPIGYGSRIAGTTGYFAPGGADLADLFAAIGTTQVAIPFNGKQYAATAQGGTGSTGLLQATTTFRINEDNSFTASASDTFTGGRTLDQGAIFAYGTAAEWEYRVYGTNGTNYDSGWRNATVPLTRQVSAQRPANAPGEVEFYEWYVFEYRRAGTGNTMGNATFSIMTGVYSWI